MSQKTSTAALDSFGEGRIPNRRRAPRHSAGGGKASREVTKQREEGREFGQAQILARQGGGMIGGRANRMAKRTCVILPVILRITCSLVLWTLGAATMAFGENQTREHRATYEFSMTP